MRLLFDVGNTRIKWAQEQDGKLQNFGVMAHTEFNVDNLATALGFDLDLDSVWVSSVAGSEVLAVIEAWAEKWGKTVHYARVGEKTGRLNNGYRDLNKLGVDRWMAAMGARCVVAEGTVLIIDAGTAVTIDVVDEKNRFQGGAIFPGLSLMHDALIGRTAGVNSLQSDSWQIIGKTTQECVNSGVRYAVVGAVERIVYEVQQSLSTETELIVTGGDAQLITRYSDLPLKRVDDLVLRGVSVYAALGCGAG